MKISFAGYVLADATAKLPPLGMTLNGVRVVEAVDLARAVSKGIFPRGNTLNTLVFTVSQEFPDLATAQNYFFGIEAAVPLSGELIITQTLANGQQPITSLIAACSNVVPVLNSVRVDTTFTIQCGRFTAGNPPGLTPDNTTPDTVRGNANATTGSESIPIAFPAAIADPIVTSLVALLVGGVPNPGIIGVTGLTGQGMTVQLDGPAPAGYGVSWQVNSGTN